MASVKYPYYWMYKDVAGQWRWTYCASNGKVISVSSESYIKRSDCEHSITIMKNSGSSLVYLPENLSWAS